MFCHGQGDPDVDPFWGGCCYVRNTDPTITKTVCPIRYFIDYTGLDPATETDQATVLDADRNPVVFGNGGSTVDDWARDLVGNSPTQRQRVHEQIQGALFICQAAVQGVVDDFSNIVVSPTEINAAAFDAAWDASAPYTTVRDLPDGTSRSLADYWLATSGELCSQWSRSSQCCFGEDAPTHAARAGNLSTTRVTIASRNEP